eukprot:COSAG06_NODE_62912_length_263_cov_2.213415_1_plen_55_part_01
MRALTVRPHSSAGLAGRTLVMRAKPIQYVSIKWASLKFDLPPPVALLYIEITTAV